MQAAESAKVEALVKVNKNLVTKMLYKKALVVEKI